LLGPQGVDEKVDEKRVVVVCWEDVWRDMRVLGGEFGDSVYWFVASNVAGRLHFSWERGLNEVVCGFAGPDGANNSKLWMSKKAASESEVMRKF